MATMFTGIVIEQGEIVQVERSERGAVFSIRCRKLAEEFRVGDSVSVDGCCLTVVDATAAAFRVEATPETLRLTNLQGRQTGDFVNLEPAARITDFLGGHLVQGHVDGRGETLSIRPEGNSWVFRFSAPESVLRYCALKGSVTVNGVSLTISGLGADYFEVTIIPHTMEVTNFATLKPGDAVNLEADVISKYVESHVKRLMGALGGFLIFLLFHGLAPAADLRLGAQTVLVYENANRLETSQFVVRLARYRPDVVLEWESARDQGTVHLFREAVEEGRGFTLTQLFEVGVDRESTETMTLLLSDALFADLSRSRFAKLKLNRIPAKMELEGRENFAVRVDQREVEVPALRVRDNRGGEWLFLESADTPLLLRFKSIHFTQRLLSLSLSERPALRWIKKLPPIR